KTRDVDERQRREFFDVMLADSARLLGTVEQVLQAARAGHRGRRMRARLVDVGELVRDCAETTRAHYNLDPNALRYVEVAGGAARAAVRGDREELRTAVSNLLDNAVKYSPKEVAVTVAVEAQDARTVAVRVSDRGVGIRPGQTRRIFNRFYRAPGRIAARVKGTGLGLFIVRSVVEQHGGRVYAESEGPGRGSTFTILLPRAAGEDR
ncbi:MAG TPA: sensor histidine kinase, partial [Pyrinomonadaceae bacterium]|nr:sensor histidine kinase [Pyrinomonadaceae bacterium]